MRIMAILNLDSIASMAEYIDKDNNALVKIILKLNQIPNFRVTYLKILWKVNVKVK